MLNQWLAEPVRHLWLPASTFIANAKGYPVLPKGTQSFIRDIMKVSGPLARMHAPAEEVACPGWPPHSSGV